MKGWVLIKKNWDRKYISNITGEEVPVYEVYTNRDKILLLKEKTGKCDDKKNYVCFKADFDPENFNWGGEN